ncbi:MAG: hypothetical protein IPN59_16910 [Holophaga sp.]|nr:hypothetical protein [Holophaga sp.]
MLKVILVLCLSCALPLFSEAGPNHLEPIPPNRWHPHLTLGVDVLIPKSNVICWMIACPAFDGEYAVSLLNTSTDFTKPTYEVQYSKAPASFMAPPPPPPPANARRIAKTSNHQHDAKLTTASRKIPTRLAKLVLTAWSKALKSTKYAVMIQHILVVTEFHTISITQMATLALHGADSQGASNLGRSFELINCLGCTKANRQKRLEQVVEKDCGSLMAKN